MSDALPLVPIHLPELDRPNAYAAEVRSLGVSAGGWVGFVVVDPKRHDSPEQAIRDGAPWRMEFGPRRLRGVMGGRKWITTLVATLHAEGVGDPPVGDDGSTHPNGGGSDALKAWRARYVAAKDKARSAMPAKRVRPVCVTGTIRVSVTVFVDPDDVPDGLRLADLATDAPCIEDKLRVDIDTDLAFDEISGYEGQGDPEGGVFALIDGRLVEADGGCADNLDVRLVLVGEAHHRLGCPGGAGCNCALSLCATNDKDTTDG